MQAREVAQAHLANTKSLSTGPNPTPKLNRGLQASRRAAHARRPAGAQTLGLETLGLVSGAMTIGRTPEPRAATAAAIALVLGLVGSACTSDPTMQSACDAFNAFLDDEATGTRTEAEGREAYLDEVHPAAIKIADLREPSNEIARGYSYFVDDAPGASAILEAGFRDFSEVCSHPG